MTLPTPFQDADGPERVQVHAGNGELSNPLPKTRATARCSTLCLLDAAHRATGKLPTQCNLNTLVLGRSVGCWDQHLTCFPLLLILQSPFACKCKHLESRAHPICSQQAFVKLHYCLPCSSHYSCREQRRNRFSRSQNHKRQSLNFAPAYGVLCSRL